MVEKLEEKSTGRDGGRGSDSIMTVGAADNRGELIVIALEVTTSASCS